MIPGRRPTENAAPITMRPGCRSGSPAERTVTLSRATPHRRFDRRFGHRVCPPPRRRPNSCRRRQRRPSALGLADATIDVVKVGATGRATFCPSPRLNPFRCCAWRRKFPHRGRRQRRQSVRSPPCSDRSAGRLCCAPSRAAGGPDGKQRKRSYSRAAAECRRRLCEPADRRALQGTPGTALPPPRYRT